MSKDQLSRYIWIVETLSRHGRLTKREIDNYWLKSRFAERDKIIPRRTFHNYRKDIEEIFGIEIKFDEHTNEYFIRTEEHLSANGVSVQSWLLNTAATHSLLGNVKELASCIFLEDVPSAHPYLNIVLEALKNHNIITFDYAPFDRTLAKKDVKIEPYFLNISKQRWYVTGYNPIDDKIKTYALDRMRNVQNTNLTFTPDPDFDAWEYSKDTYGVIFTSGKTHEVIIKANSRQAKYLRALPLHHSQKEEYNGFDYLFHYRLKLTPDFVADLMALGPNVTVEKPHELKIMLLDLIRKTLSNYDLTTVSKPSQNPIG